MMRCGHLFNGISGFGLAAHWMGWTNVFHCEIDDFCNRVMNKHFPNSIQHGNIKEQDFTGYRGTIDLLTGGFPCQPYSAAGKRKGKEDERHLWPEMLRAIREIQPGWIVGENVRGLTNWNGGLVFDEVQADLEAEGYEVLPFLLPAAGVNAPHRRDRIWFIANALSKRTAASAHRCNQSWELFQENQREENKQLNKSFGEGRVIADSAIQSEREQADETNAVAEGRQTWVEPGGSGDRWSGFPTQPPVCSGDDGLPTKLDGITFSKWRRKTIEAAGNAIVPQVAYQIFQAIEQYRLITVQEVNSRI